MDSPLVSLFPGMGSSRRPPPDVAERLHRERFEMLYRAHLRLVRHVVREVGIREADVADVVQEVFAILDRELRRGLDTSASLRGWLKRTACRLARNFKKRAFNREEPARESTIELLASGPDPEEKIDTEVNVRAVLDQLPDEQQAVLVMSDVFDMPMREIAEELEIPVGTGNSRLRAARIAFKRGWNDRRASGLAVVAPFALWDAPSLLRSMRAVPEPPPGFEDEVWARLVDSLGWTVAGMGAAAAAGGALAAGAAKAGVVLTTKQIAAGIIASALVGAGAYASARAALDASTSEPTAAVVIAARDEGRALGHASALASSSAPVAPVALAPSIAPTGSVTAAPSAVAPTTTAAAERFLLDTARAKLDRGDIQAARAALERVKSERFRDERDELWRAVLAYQGGGR